MQQRIFPIVLLLVTVSIFSQPKDSPAKKEAPTIQSTPTPAPSNSDHKPANHTETTKSGSPHWYISSEWWLVIIAGLTGFAIWYQAREMSKTTEIIGRQADLMKTQTEILVEYNKATREAANAAIKNAATASESVEFLIAKERMRISVEALPLNIPPPDEVLGHVVDYKITFHGPTLATFVEGFAESEITDSIESPTGNITWGISLPHIIPSGAEPGIRIAPLYRRLTQDEIYALFSGTSFMHFRGFICYKDVFDRKRWNRFNRVWQYSRLSRMDGTRWGYWSNCGRPEDNSETEPN